LEQVKETEELGAATSELEIAKSTSQEQQPISEKPKTRTEEEFRKAQSSWDARINEAKTEAMKAKAEVERLSKQAERYQAEQELLALEKFADDPELLEAFKDRKAIVKERLDLLQERQGYAEEREAVAKQKETSELLARASYLGTVARELHDQYGIPIKELEECDDPRDMKIKALEYKKSETTEETKGKPPKFASPISSGGGKGSTISVDAYRGMSPQERLKFHREHPNVIIK